MVDVNAVSTTNLVPTDPVVSDVPKPPQAGKSTRHGFTKILEANALLLLTIAFAVFFSLWPRTSDMFFTMENIGILLSGQAVVGIVSIGVLLPLITQEFDLSVGSNAALSAVLVTMMVSSGVPVGVAVLGGLVTGLLIGLFNVGIVNVVGITGIIATLGSSTILVGILTHVTGGLALTSKIPPAFTTVGNGNLFGIPIIFMILIGVAAIAYFFLEHTPFGRQLYASGSNPAAAKLVGIDIKRMKAIAFVACGVLAAIGGILYVTRAGGASPKIATVFLMPAIAAAFLSAAAVKPGRYNVWGTIVAIYFLAVLNNGLSLAGAPAYVSDYSNGAALILGVAVAVVIRRRRDGARA
ncbi:ABC transporter permease [Salinibacterium sp. ZJ450]|uniref:ABC transporter permease n=1 Tax=Salinibacterium sp. ZJ450 TaxID=2708338 RepID=UPI0014224B06|nr:ABC transporter permease [Salinibacterium sp. ZJ450]